MVDVGWLEVEAALKKTAVHVGYQRPGITQRVGPVRGRIVIGEVIDKLRMFGSHSW